MEDRMVERRKGGEEGGQNLIPGERMVQKEWASESLRRARVLRWGT